MFTDIVSILADLTDGQTKNQANSDRDAQHLERLTLHTRNGLVFEVAELLDAPPN